MKTAASDQIVHKLLAAILDHVPFDGWSERSFKAAIADTGIDNSAVLAACPRGALDLALAFHAAGDQAMLDKLEATDLGALRFRDKIATAVRFRLEVIDNREAVRRGATMFALPQFAGEGAKAIWGTCDKIWIMLGDTSDDVNWYSKRATLSAVYSSTVLFWLGDDSEGHQATWEFLDRRIENVMQFEKIKAQVNDNPLLKKVLAGPLWALGKVKAPSKTANLNLPGRWNDPH